MAKNQFQMHILWFFFHADIKMTRKRPWNLYKYKTFSFKNVFSLMIEYGMYLKCLQKRVNLAALLVQNKPSAPIRRVENKVEFLERQCHSENRSFVYKKETEHSFELSLSICVLYRRIFNLEMQNFSLQNHHMLKAWWNLHTNKFLGSKVFVLRYRTLEFLGFCVKRHLAGGRESSYVG